MAQITVEITQWLRAPTSSLSQDTPHYSTLNCFHSKKQTNKLLLHFKCGPLGTQPQCHPTKSTTPPGKQVGLGPQWPQAGLQAGTLGARAPCRANRRNLDQSSACEWVRWRQQAAAQSFSWAWHQMSNSTSVLHLKTRSNNSSTCSEKSNHQSTQQMSAFFSSSP